MAEMNLPDELGITIQTAIAEANPELSVGWLIIAVSHGKQIQTMSNLDEHSQMMACEIACRAMGAESNIGSTLLNPEGSA